MAGDPMADDTMEERLAAVAQRRDRDAFGALFAYFAPRIKAFMCRRGVAPDAAEEVVQETMANVWRRAAQYDPSRASASSWIFAIARNAHIDLVRRENRPAPDPDDPAAVPDPDPGAHSIVAGAQEARRVNAAIAGLPAEQREVLRLAFFEDKAHAAIADELDIPLGTVKSRIRLAFRRMRSELGDFE